MDRHWHNLGWHTDDLSGFRFCLHVRGEPVVLKNSKQIVTLPGRRPILVPSPAAKGWLRSATKQLAAQWSIVFAQPLPIQVQVNAQITTYLGSRRRSDASNCYQGPEDAMQAAGVLTDDYQIAAHDGSRRRYDKGDPRVEIVLTPMGETGVAHEHESGRNQDRNRHSARHDLARGRRSKDQAAR